MSGRQIEFPLAVAVCAWCRPRELGGGLGTQSHGICPRHLRKLRQDLQARNGGRLSGLPRRRRAARPAGAEALALPL